MTSKSKVVVLSITQKSRMYHVNRHHRDSWCSTTGQQYSTGRHASPASAGARAVVMQARGRRRRASHNRPRCGAWWASLSLSLSPSQPGPSPADASGRQQRITMAHPKGGWLRDGCASTLVTGSRFPPRGQGVPKGGRRVESACEWPQAQSQAT